MTNEEMQQVIEGMLSVQRELQNRQLAFMDELEAMKLNIQGLIHVAAETNVKFERLVGYSINRERDSLDIQQDILDLKRRVTQLEQR
ncbi:hypothetical protein DO97_00980 [Neosynechococcus sphagnicola sy1]|uniref:Uncharacterized protein n=1 Tax=Neosynechococcus sphagnicola sy1 TaxID=1497020 RepID=A0A098TFL2_9CYAN|nr:hypothetical protein [Neosynechococcus sphagnicola]KGF71350.1 hypothetical protein DO97_00980 [Neosynechococcus sphagnicola sy1]